MKKIQPINTTKRNSLIKDEKHIRRKWANKNEFMAEPVIGKEKYFLTFPFPYSNGTLHLGHAYTLSKLEFFSRYQKLRCVNVLFPVGFHGTGMTIVACATKLKESLEKYDINKIDIESLPDNDQIKILSKMDIEREEIPKFVDPYYWIEYFPS